jgi:hypothetical protein
MIISLHSFDWLAIAKAGDAAKIRRSVQSGIASSIIALGARLKASRFDWSYKPSFAKRKLSEIRCKQGTYHHPAW